MIVVTIFQLYLALESNQYQRRCDWKSLHCLFCIDTQQETIHVQQHHGHRHQHQQHDHSTEKLKLLHILIYHALPLSFHLPKRFSQNGETTPKMIHLMMIENFKCFLEISSKKVVCFFVCFFPWFSRWFTGLTHMPLGKIHIQVWCLVAPGVVERLLWAAAKCLGWPGETWDFLFQMVIQMNSEW